MRRKSRYSFKANPNLSQEMNDWLKSHKMVVFEESNEIILHDNTKCNIIFYDYIELLDYITNLKARVK